MARLAYAALVSIVILLLQANPCGAQNVTRVAACTATRRVSPACECRLSESRPRVDCISRQLTAVPSSIPTNITVLVLSNNLIREIYANDLRGMEQVETLFLQDNVIEVIHPLAFRNMYKLTTLVLENNRLTAISSQLFQHLPSLTDLNLQRNHIERISRYAFATMRKVRIALNENHLQCDCEMWALKQWLDNQSDVKLSTARCANTKDNRPLTDMTQSDFPSCTASDSAVYHSNLSCLTCANAKSMKECVKRGSYQTCVGSQNACTTEVAMVQRHLLVTKRCMAVSSCLVAEWYNVQGCGVSGTGPYFSFRCRYCCLTRRCNRATNSSEGRTREMRFRMSVQLLLPSENALAGNVNNTGTLVASVVQNVLIGTNYAGYYVEFQGARDPATTLVFLVQATAVNTPSVRWRDVREAVNATLLSQFSSGYVGNVRIVPGSLQFGDIPYPDQGHLVGSGGSPTENGNCSSEWELTPYGTFVWPVTFTGHVTGLPCPFGSRIKGFSANRNCVLEWGIPRWGASNLDGCHYASDAAKDLSSLSQQRIDSTTAPQVAKELESLSRQAENFGKEDVRLSVITATNVLKEPSVLQSHDTISTLVNTFSNLISAPSTAIEEAQREDHSGTKLLEAIDVLNRGASLRNGSLVAVQPRLAVVAVALTPGQPFPGFRFSASTPDNSSLSKDKVEVKNDTSSSLPDASDRTTITLPASMMTSQTASRVAFNLFQNDNLFSAIQVGGKGQKTAVKASNSSKDTKIQQPGYFTKVNSHVIAATVPGVTVQGLQDPVLVSLAHRRKDAKNPSCVFWDKTASNWSTSGCRVHKEEDNYTVCACDHLTNFALLMDVYQTGNTLSEADKRALSLISYIGCGVSLVGLLITLLSYALFNCRRVAASGSYSLQGESGTNRKLRKDNPSKILINLCIALAASCLVFVAGMQQYTFDSPVGCKVVAALLHYFMLSALTWMAVQAFYMYLALVRVFNTYFSNFMLKCCLVGWGVPLVIVAITLGVNKTDNYGLLDGNICWLHTIPFYAAFVTPVLLILTLNIITFTLVLRTLLGYSSRKLHKSADRTSMMQQLRGAIAIVVLLGLTWIFAIFAIGGASVIFNYLFAIFNSLQGLFIFIFYCLLKKDARTQWLRLLPCCHVEDEKSTTAATTSKGDSSSGVSRQTAKQTMGSDSDVRGRGQSYFVNHRGEVFQPRQNGDVVSTSDVRLEAFNQRSSTSI